MTTCMLHPKGCSLKKPTFEITAMLKFSATALTVTAVAAAFAAKSAFAADPNGYKAKYEKDIGSVPACDVTFTPGQSRSAIESELNGSDGDRVFCFAPGNYKSAGLITITKDGSSSARRWMRLAGSDTTHPVKLSTSKRAVIKFLAFKGASYWTVHRMTVDGDKVYSTRTVELDSSSSNNIFDHMLVEENGRNTGAFEIKGADRTTVQNTVVRNSAKLPNLDNSAVTCGNSATDCHIVNNEVYNHAGDGVVVVAGSLVAGLVVENNDFYLEPDVMYTGDRACAENGIDLKNAGTASKPARLIHNRIWGYRASNISCATSGSAGEAINIHDDGSGGTYYVIVQDNIIMDSPRGISSPTGGGQKVSVIGNVFYNIHSTLSDKDACALDLSKFAKTEVYLNTIIDSDDYWLRLGGTDLDVQCNVVINGTNKTGTTRSGTTVDYNAFYATPSFSTNGSSNDISYSRAADSKDESYCFYRKIWSGPEKTCIPYAKPTTASPHYKACKTTLGSRSGVGVDDKALW